MLNDPIAVDANAPNPALSFAMIRTDQYGSERRDGANGYAVVINHNTGKNGDRHYFKISKTVDATNPYNDLVSPQSASVSVSIARPKFGFTESEIKDLFQAALDTIASPDAGIERIIGFES